MWEALLQTLEGSAINSLKAVTAPPDRAIMEGQGERTWGWKPLNLRARRFQGVFAAVSWDDKL